MTGYQVSTNDVFLRSNTGAAQKLLGNKCNMTALRTNTILQKDEWVALDKRVVQVAKERLTAVDDLISNGLVLNLGGIGVTLSEFQTESDMSPAVVSMEPESEGLRDNLEYALESVPIPIIHKDFTIGLRQLEASRRMGSNIDLSTADVAARKVAEGMEDMVLKGYDKTFSGKSIYGYTSHPCRITGAALPWSDPANIYKTVLEMVAAAEASHKYGPYVLYIAGGLGMKLYQVYDDGSGQTVEQRLKNITPIQTVRVAERLEPGNLVLVQMTSDTVDLAVAQTLISVEWTTNGGMTTQYKVLTALAPRIKADANGKLGIVHYIGA